MIDIADLNVSAGDFRLRDINLRVEDASFGVILGPSGSGKTLLLESIVGLYGLDKGTVMIGTHDVTRTSPEERNLAYVPQDLALFPHLGVHDNLCFGAQTRQIPKNEIKQRLGKLTELLDIRHLLDRHDPGTLSHGEQQRVAIARAMMINPRAILLDEPFSALDARLRRQLQQMLLRVNRELKVTILHVTHDREEAFMLGNQIGVMINGQLLQVGNRDEIYYRPATVEVARFLLNQNIFSGEVSARDNSTQTLSLKGSGINIQAVAYNGLKPGDAVHFGIRPEEIMVIRPGKTLNDPVQANLMEGTVVTIMKKGGSHLIFIKVPDIQEPLEIDIPNCAYRDLELAEGHKVHISLKKKSVWTIPAKHTTEVPKFMA
jgi:ABC-type Fe3+/spermidine/putrescine transport system ATPase subunit